MFENTSRRLLKRALCGVLGLHIYKVVGVQTSFFWPIQNDNLNIHFLKYWTLVIRKEYFPDFHLFFSLNQLLLFRFEWQAQNMFTVDEFLD